MTDRSPARVYYSSDLGDPGEVDSVPGMLDARARSRTCVPRRARADP
jgi:hypothetical protein